MSEEGIKYDSDKVKLSLLPFKALREVGEVFTYGANKYSANNWKKVAPFELRYQDAALRHIFSYMEGELIDPESGYSHLAHAIANLLYLSEGVD